MITRKSELGTRNKSKTHGLWALGLMLLILVFSAALLADDVTTTVQPAVAATAAPAAKPAVKKHAKVKPKKAAPAAETAASEPVTQAAEPAAVTASAAALSVTTGAKVLTYEECYSIAAEKNRDYKIAKLDKSMAEAELAKAAASFGPTMSLGASYDPMNVQAPLLMPYGSEGYRIFAPLFAPALLPPPPAPLMLSGLFPRIYLHRACLPDPADIYFRKDPVRF